MPPISSASGAKGKSASATALSTSILAALRLSDTPLSATEVAELLGEKRARVSRELVVMKRSGILDSKETDWGRVQYWIRNTSEGPCLLQEHWKGYKICPTRS